MAKTKLKKGDQVVVISGTSKGAKGKILKVDAEAQKVIVEGVNMITKHQKARGGVQQGGIIKQEAPIHISNVMYLQDGTPTRLGIKTETQDGKVVRTRFAKKSNKVVD